MELYLALAILMFWPLLCSGQLFSHISHWSHFQPGEDGGGVDSDGADGRTTRFSPRSTSKTLILPSKGPFSRLAWHRGWRERALAAPLVNWKWPLGSNRFLIYLYWTEHRFGSNVWSFNINRHQVWFKHVPTPNFLLADSFPVHTAQTTQKLLLQVSIDINLVNVRCIVLPSDISIAVHMCHNSHVTV